MCMSPIIKMVGFTVACGWEANSLMTRSDSRLRGLQMNSSKPQELAYLLVYSRKLMCSNSILHKMPKKPQIISDIIQALCTNKTRSILLI